MKNVNNTEIPSTPDGAARCSVVGGSLSCSSALAVLETWKKWRIEAREAEQAAKLDGRDEIARRYACVASTYFTCECNLRDALYMRTREENASGEPMPAASKSISQQP